MNAFIRRFRRQRELKVSIKAMEVCEAIISELGAEIHDDLIQKLSVLRLNLDQVERSLNDPTAAKEAVIRMQVDFQNVIESVRHLSRRLHPIHFESDSFERKIELLCQHFESAGTTRVTPKSFGIPFDIDVRTAHYLLRMIQELIHNSFRHSLAWHVWVTLKWNEHSLQIEVEDDGSQIVELERLIKRLTEKHNTLKMRADSIGGTIRYDAGSNGLKGIIDLPRHSL